jgi:hypothetical protein
MINPIAATFANVKRLAISWIDKNVNVPNGNYLKGIHKKIIAALCPAGNNLRRAYNLRALEKSSIHLGYAAVPEMPECPRFPILLFLLI